MILPLRTTMLPFWMSPLLIVMIVALRIAMSWAASAAGARRTPQRRRSSRGCCECVCAYEIPLVEASLDEDVFDRSPAREQIVSGHDDEVGELADLDRARRRR